MPARLVSGSAYAALVQAVAAASASDEAACDLQRFPDGELRPTVTGIRGDDVYVVAGTGPPVSDSIVELLLVLDACRRGGADRITAVMPYFGYARQDRRGRPGEAVGARLVADALAGAGAQRLVVVDPHTPALEAMCSVPMEMVTAVPVLARALAPDVPDGAVVVAPDLGAAKLAERYASLLGRTVAVVRKTRVSGDAVHAEELVGDVGGRQALIVDDMISTGGTIEAAIRILLATGALPEIVVAATHGLLVGNATERLSAAPIRRLVVTDSVPTGAAGGPGGLPVQVQSIAPLLADVVGRLHRDEELTDLLVRT